MAFAAKHIKNGAPDYCMCELCASVREIARQAAAKAFDRCADAIANVRPYKNSAIFRKWANEARNGR